MVHNDVELHWSSFIAADRILASRLTGAAHFVVEGADRLTNRRSAVRLDVICAFERVLNRLAEQSDPGRLIFLEPFVRFAWDLLSWVRRNIEDEYCPELRKRAQRLFLDHLDLRLMTLIAYGDPALGSRINQLILNGVLP
jgi:hypothetical protein